MLKKYIILCLYITSLTGASNNTPIENYRKNYFQILGEEDASDESKKILESTLSEFKNKKLLPPDKTIILKNLSPSGLARLENDNIPTRYNIINNGNDIIHMGTYHAELSNNAQRFILAHELGHITLTHKPHLNPHYWISNIDTLSTFLTPAAIIWNIYGTNNRARKPFAIACSAGLLLTNIFLANQRQLAPPSRKDHAHYVFCSKYEEAICDVIAATTIKNSASGGIEYFQKSLTYNGNTNGTNGSHPSIQTRINYLGCLQKFQSWYQQHKS